MHPRITFYKNNQALLPFHNMYFDKPFFYQRFFNMCDIKETEN